MLGLSLATLISRMLTLVVAFTVHELAHAYTADWFGDDTPRLHGRLTLNPLAHLDPLGSILILFAGFGWAKPVPINPVALERRNPYAPLWVSLAGPVSNLILAGFAAIPFQLGLVSVFGTASEFFPTPSQFLTEFIFLNLILLFFNLIPIYPLDGEKVLMYLLPPQSRSFLNGMRRYGSYLLLALIFVGPMVGFDLLSVIIGTPTRALFLFLVG